MSEIDRLWQVYEEYKKTAEQHEFFKLFMLDSKLVPAYNDLKSNPSKEHSIIFLRCMRQVLAELGVNLSELD